MIKSETEKMEETLKMAWLRGHDDEGKNYVHIGAYTATEAAAFLREFEASGGTREDVGLCIGCWTDRIKNHPVLVMLDTAANRERLPFAIDDEPAEKEEAE